MIGMVLAAGAGRRLRPYTDTLPKALIPVADDTAILDISLHNLAAVGLTDVVVVVGYAADAVTKRVAELQDRHGVQLTLVHNDKAEIWNNAYSMWVAREHMAGGALMVNGDTVHPPSVEEALLAARGPDILLAVDQEKALGEEEMKVLLDAEGYLTKITKLMDPASAHGEYIGASLIEPTAVPALAAALQATFERDPNLYYEDGYQTFVERGGRIGTAPIPVGTSWVEVDDHRDLDRAREIACLY
ncbi:MAG TPA: phosphocholine cytidylyltransferase family protein [Propionibacteriaceae bacterium]|nr:phosphocholine cytidylyltransferase family protein [Propionibacteriaceae bacterium]